MKIVNYITKELPVKVEDRIAKFPKLHDLLYTPIVERQNTALILGLLLCISLATSAVLTFADPTPIRHFLGLAN